MRRGTAFEVFTWVTGVLLPGALVIAALFFL
jgi:hypothetical protein